MDIGAELRSARESKGLTIAAVAQRTRVQPRILEAIEVNNLSAIPPKPFGRGFVRTYASMVHMDPDRTVQEYFAQFPSSPPTAPVASRHRSLSAEFDDEPSRWNGVGIAAVILLLVVASAAILRPREQAADGPAVVGTSGSAADASTPAPTTPAPAPAAAPAAATPAAPVRLAFTVSRPCWVTATVDGQRVIYRTVAPGESQTLEAQRDIAIRFGDAGAVSWTLNGTPQAAPGRDGAVRDLRLTPKS